MAIGANYKCDVCSKRIKYGESYIAYLDIDGGRLNFCLPCAEKNPDNKQRDGVEWVDLIVGVRDAYIVKK